MFRIENLPIRFGVRGIMYSAFIHCFGILAGLVVWNEAIPCAVTSEAGCVSCVKWRDIIPGHVYCKYNNNGANGRKMSCERIKFANRICVEEKIGWPRCVRTRTVSEHTKISLKRLGHTRRENIELNEGVMKRNGDICLEGTHPKNCATMVLNKGTETCKTLRAEYGLTEAEFTHLNPGVECSDDRFLPQTSLCVKDAFCSHRHTITNEDTCGKLQRAFKIGSHSFQQLNPGVQCGNLAVGSTVCVWPNTNRPLPNMKCVDHAHIKRGDTCLSITVKYGRPFDELLFLNPSLDCSQLELGSKICTRGRSSQICARIVDVAPLATCSQLITSHAVSSKQFYENNPLLQCVKLNETQQICGGRGYFKAIDCKRYAMIPDNETTLQTLTENPPSVVIEDISLPHDEKLKRVEERLLSYNKKLRKISRTKKLTAGSLICIAPESADRFTRMRNIADALYPRSPMLSQTLIQYENNPSMTTSNRLRDLFLSELRNEHVYALLLDLNRRNATVKQALTEPTDAKDGQMMCDHLLRTDPHSAAAKCFCNSTQLYIHCQSQMSSAVLDAKPRSAFNSFRGRSGHFGLSGIFGSIRKGLGLCELDGFSQLLYVSRKNVDLCLKGECSIPLHAAVCLKLSGGVCTSIWSEDMYKASAYQLENEYRSDRKAFQHAYASKLTTNMFFGVSFCATPSKFSGFLSFLETCVDVFKITYHPWKGILTLSSGLQGLFNFFVRVNMHYFLYDIKPEWDPNSDGRFDKSVCGLEEYRCADFCIWRRNRKSGVDNRMYTSIEWGFDSPPFGAHTETIPSGFVTTSECTAEQGFITITNERTCDEFVEVVCSETIEFRTTLVASERLRRTLQLSFPIGNVNALYTCTFASSGGGQESIDVFGGVASTAPTSHFYTMLEDNTIKYSSLTEPETRIAGQLAAQECDKGKRPERCTEEIPEVGCYNIDKVTTTTTTPTTTVLNCDDLVPSPDCPNAVMSMARSFKYSKVRGLRADRADSQRADKAIDIQINPWKGCKERLVFHNRSDIQRTRKLEREEPEKKRRKMNMEAEKQDRY